MPVSVGEILQARIMGTVLGQQFAVSQFYRVTQDFAGATAPGVGFDVWRIFKVQWRAVQGTTAGFTTSTVSIASVTDPTGIGGTYNIPAAEQQGTAPRTGDAMPAFNAFGITLRGDSRIVRPGSRRIPFVLETDSTAGGLVASIDLELRVLAEKFVLPLLSDNIIIGEYAEPVLVGRTREGAWDFSRVQRITQSSINPWVTSQVSRKRGRGA